MRDRIITPIPFLSFAITKETTKSRSRLKFVVFMRLKKNETSRSKRSKVMIVRRWPKETLIRSLIMDDRTWNTINRINSIKSSFTPKRGRGSLARGGAWQRVAVRGGEWRRRVAAAGGAWHRAETSGGAWERVRGPMKTKFHRKVDRRDVFPMVQSVVWSEKRKRRWRQAVVFDVLKSRWRQWCCSQQRLQMTPKKTRLLKSGTPKD